MSGPQLDTWLRRSAVSLETAMSDLTAEQWATEVLTAQGRTVPATETPWMRAREVFVHAVDLDLGVGFADLPTDFLDALVVDITRKRGDVEPVDGPLPEVAAWLAGRPSSLTDAPELGPWLRPQEARGTQLAQGRPNRTLHQKCTMVHPMDDLARELSAAIGAKVRAERHSREWTLDQLAAATGVSRRMIVNVEQGSANPSVTTLLRISDALGIGLQALVAVPQSKPVKVVRHGEGAALWSGPGGGRGVLLAGTAPPDVLELWDWTLAVGDRHDSEAHVRGTKEILQVREGTVTVVVADQVEVLEVGDAISFASDVAHAYANEGTEPARFSLTVLEPGVGAGSTSEASHD